MALEIRSIPVLTGETAERFVRESSKRITRNVQGISQLLQDQQ